MIHTATTTLTVPPNMNPLSQAWRSFWHTMTSNDRHASHDSPYRTGQHMPISQSRHAPLTSVATSAVESQADLDSFDEDSSKRPYNATTILSSSPGNHSSPNRAPYSPGMRSLASPKKTSAEETVAAGEIQMQSFADGAPPPPPVSHSWKKIDRWLEHNYQELFDQLGEGCTQNDINELEHELDCSLPQDVRESLATHDGQERGGTPTGVVFGCMLLDCEEIVQEWKNWRKVNDEYLNARAKSQPEYPLKGLNNGSSSSSSHHSQNGTNKLWRQELQDRQDSQPPKAIQKAYAHPSWIPLARDWGGNNIAVDLAPGQLGKWGQVIIFGRDYDCKYVVARSWSHFMAVLADDMNSDKTFVIEDSGELKLKEFKTDNVEPGYLDILRWRSDQKYGRRGQKRKPPVPPGLNTNVNGKSSRDSPYNSPTVSNDERGRSPHRFSRGPNSSPRQQVGSPLARVNEEIVAPIPVRAGGDVIKDFATAADTRNSTRSDKLVDLPTPVELSKNKEKLVEAPTPITAIDDKKYEFSGLARVETMPPLDEDKENQAHPPVTGLGVDGMDDDEMKNVQI